MGRRCKKTARRKVRCHEANPISWDGPHGYWRPAAFSNRDFEFSIESLLTGAQNTLLEAVSRMIAAVSRCGRRGISSRFNCLGIGCNHRSCEHSERDWYTYSRALQFSIPSSASRCIAAIKLNRSPGTETALAKERK